MFILRKGGEVKNSTGNILLGFYSVSLIFGIRSESEPVFSSSGFEFGLRWLDGDLTPPRVEG